MDKTLKLKLFMVFKALVLEKKTLKIQRYSPASILENEDEWWYRWPLLWASKNYTGSPLQQWNLRQDFMMSISKILLRDPLFIRLFFQYIIIKNPPPSSPIPLCHNLRQVMISTLKQLDRERARVWISDFIYCKRNLPYRFPAFNARSMKSNIWHHRVRGEGGGVKIGLTDALKWLNSVISHLPHIVILVPGQINRGRSSLSGFLLSTLANAPSLLTAYVK